MKRPKRDWINKPYKKGQYVICRCTDNSGTNGDILAGRIVSVRTKGVVVVQDLLVDKAHYPQHDTLRKRVAQVSKEVAMQVCDHFKKTNGDKKSTRELAVTLAAKEGVEPSPQEVLPFAAAVPVVEASSGGEVPAGPAPLAVFEQFMAKLREEVLEEAAVAIEVRFRKSLVGRTCAHIVRGLKVFKKPPTLTLKELG